MLGHNHARKQNEIITLLQADLHMQRHARVLIGDSDIMSIITTSNDF